MKKRFLLKLYLFQIRKCMPRPHRARLCQELLPIVEQYLDKHPEATLQTLYTEYGSPKALQYEFAAEASTPFFPTNISIFRLLFIIFMLLLLFGLLATLYVAATTPAGVLPLPEHFIAHP